VVIKYTPQYADDSDQVVIQELDYATSYRRPRIEQQVEIDEEPLKDDILIRLRLARMLAVMKAEGYELRKTQT